MEIKKICTSDDIYDCMYSYIEAIQRKLNKNLEEEIVINYIAANLTIYRDDYDLELNDKSCNINEASEETIKGLIEEIEKKI